MESKITAARQIDQLRAHQLRSGALDAVQGLEHERNDGKESEHDQSGADAKDRLMTPRTFRRCVARLCLNLKHHTPDLCSAT